MTGTEYLTQLNKASMLCLIIGVCFLVLTVILCFALRIPHIIRNITGRAMKREIRRHMRGMNSASDFPCLGIPKSNDDPDETVLLIDGRDDETDILPENTVLLSLDKSLI